MVLIFAWSHRTLVRGMPASCWACPTLQVRKPSAQRHRIEAVTSLISLAHGVFELAGAGSFFRASDQCGQPGTSCPCEPTMVISAFQRCCRTTGVLAGVFGTAATGYILKHGTWDEVWGVAVALYLVGAVVWNVWSTGAADIHLVKVQSH